MDRASETKESLDKSSILSNELEERRTALSYNQIIRIESMNVR
jgi:hypothetical protein